MIYYKQEKFNLAEIHFKKALSINPQSSVLLCHIGVVGALPEVLSPCSLPELMLKACARCSLAAAPCRCSTP